MYYNLYYFNLKIKSFVKNILLSKFTVQLKRSFSKYGETLFFDSLIKNPCPELFEHILEIHRHQK